MKFYGVATNEKGLNVRVPVDATLRHQAEDEACDYCVKNGLNYEGVHMVQGTQRQPSTMAKRFTSGKPTPRKRRKAMGRLAPI